MQDHKTQSQSQSQSQPQDPLNLTPEQQVQAARANAVNRAIVEILHEQRAEVIRRATKTLRELGLTVREQDTQLD
jgi:methylmalonyl-CoA mutase cobalamin-binding subunit